MNPRFPYGDAVGVCCPGVFVPGVVAEIPGGGGVFIHGAISRVRVRKGAL